MSRLLSYSNISNAFRSIHSSNNGIIKNCSIRFAEMKNKQYNVNQANTPVIEKLIETITDINLYRCNPEHIQSLDLIHQYMNEVHQMINTPNRSVITRYNHFKNDRHNTVQFLQLSNNSSFVYPVSIIGKFSEPINSAHINIAARYEYDADTIAKFTSEFFKAMDWSYFIKKV